MEQLNNYQILDRSVGPFQLGKEPKHFKEELKQLSASYTIAYELVSDIFWRINIADTILITVNIYENKVAQIAVKGSFTGSLLEKIKIGDAAGKIGEQFELEYDEDENFYRITSAPTVVLEFKDPYQTIEDDPENALVEITIAEKALLYW